MHVFFRDEMVVKDFGLTAPAHQKQCLLMDLLYQRPATVMVSEFEPMDWNRWAAVHDSDMVSAIRSGDPDLFDHATVPVSPQMVASLKYDGGSFIAGASAAIEHGCAFSPTSGFHHAHWAQPGPLCLLNALPLAALHALSHSPIQRVLILDCDYHRGDGTEDILMRLGDERIVHESLGYRFSRRQQAGDYLETIERIAMQIEAAEFDFVIYQAGMDVLLGDPAGGGLLTLAETKQRDRRVFEACARASIPIVWNLAGGYPREGDSPFAAVLEGHVNSFEVAVQAFG